MLVPHKNHSLHSVKWLTLGRVSTLKNNTKEGTGHWHSSLACRLLSKCLTHAHMKMKWLNDDHFTLYANIIFTGYTFPALSLSVCLPLSSLSLSSLCLPINPSASLSCHAASVMMESIASILSYLYCKPPSSLLFLLPLSLIMAIQHSLSCIIAPPPASSFFPLPFIFHHTTPLVFMFNPFTHNHHINPPLSLLLLFL